MNMDGNSNFGNYVVTGLAIVGIALGGSALYVSLNSRKEASHQNDLIAELEQKAERLNGATEELQGQIRGLYNQTRTQIDGLASQIAAIHQPAPSKAPELRASVTSVAVDATPEASASAKSYTVRAGDLVAKIAKAHNTSVDAILKANPGLRPERIKVGQVIQLP